MGHKKSKNSLVFKEELLDFNYNHKALNSKQCFKTPRHNQKKVNQKVIQKNKIKMNPLRT